VSTAADAARTAQAMIAASEPLPQISSPSSRILPKRQYLLAEIVEDLATGPAEEHKA
jgi:hypothetical protein